MAPYGDDGFPIIEFTATSLDSVQLTGAGDDGFPIEADFFAEMDEYVAGLNAKKREKALMSQKMYNDIIRILQDPKATDTGTAQFRFWAKKSFRLLSTATMELIVHENRPVAVREQIYNILVHSHAAAHHGGRDKTSTQVRRYYSFIPKDLIARFVRNCPTCVGKKAGNRGLYSSDPVDSKSLSPTRTLSSISPPAVVVADQGVGKAPRQRSRAKRAPAPYPLDLTRGGIVVPYHSSPSSGSGQDSSMMMMMMMRAPSNDSLLTAPLMSARSSFSEGSSAGILTPNGDGGNIFGSMGAYPAMAEQEPQRQHAQAMMAHGSGGSMAMEYGCGGDGRPNMDMAMATAQMALAMQEGASGEAPAGYTHSFVTPVDMSQDQLVMMAAQQEQMDASHAQHQFDQQYYHPEQQQPPQHYFPADAQLPVDDHYYSQAVMQPGADMHIGYAPQCDYPPTFPPGQPIYDGADYLAPQMNVYGYHGDMVANTEAMKQHVLLSSPEALHDATNDFMLAQTNLDAAAALY